MEYQSLNNLLINNNINLFDFELRILQKRINNLQEFTKIINNKFCENNDEYCCNYILQKKGIFISIKHFNKIKHLTKNTDFNIFNWINTTSQHKLFLFVNYLLQSKWKKVIYLVHE